MEIIQFFLDFILHVDTHVDSLLATMGYWSYAILFLIIFAETGFIVTPFLPGDSLLFAIGAICARENSTLNIVLIIVLLIIAAILGDAVNYIIGKKFGMNVLNGRLGKFVRKENIEKTHQFYEKHGGKTIIFARFIPIIRTFAPFVAGIGSMTYSKFATYNIVGGVVWITSFSVLGYFFGNFPIVQKNFKLIIVGIIILSILPAVIEYFRQRQHSSRS